MLISVIIPVYNAEKYIAKCLESVVRAKKKNDIEIVLINDGSTDSSLSVCEQFSQKYSFIRVFSQKNEGPSLARNKGIEIAEGEFIVFVDADDYVEKDYLEELYNSIVNSESDLACCGYIDHSEYGIIEATNYSTDTLYKASNFLPFVLEKVGGVLWDKIFRKELIVKNGVLFNSTIRLSEDLLFVLEYLRYTNKVSIVKKHLYHYNRIDQNGLSKKFTLAQFSTIMEVNTVVLNLVQYFDVDVKLVTSYLEKRRNSFLVRYSNQIVTHKISCCLKRKMLEDLRLNEKYNFNFKTQNMKSIDYPLVFFMNLKKYRLVIYYCVFLNRIKSLLNKQKRLN